MASLRAQTFHVEVIVSRSLLHQGPDAVVDIRALTVQTAAQRVMTDAGLTRADVVSVLFPNSRLFWLVGVQCRDGVLTYSKHVERPLQR